MIRKFVETPEFMRMCERIGVKGDHMRELQNELLANPKKGDLIVGSGGARKVRVGCGQRGKSGSYRFFTPTSHRTASFFSGLCWTKKKLTTLPRMKRRLLN